MVIGELTVLAELGAGAGSRVFRVRRSADSEQYALKVVPVGRGADPRYGAQLRHEFRIGQMLDHPNLARVHALEVLRDWLFRPTTARLLVAFAPGQALDKLGPLPVGCALRVFERTAAALEHMHTRGVFHADLKPRNVIYDPRHGVKVIDFGLAWVTGEPKGRLQGTPQYMAPETIAHKLINARTEVYNFGAMMYHVIGRRPLPAPTIGVSLGARAHAARVPAVASLNPEAPAELCELIHWCIRYEAGQRPANMSAVRTVLDRLAVSCEAKRPRESR